MQKPAGTLPSGGNARAQPGGSHDQDQVPCQGAPRFLYTSGFQPFDGYTIKRGIGVGGFGEVYYATSDAGKDVALKHIQRNLDVELRGVRQCLNLKHPNLLSLYDIKYDREGRAWVVMEYVAGESLRDVIDRNPNGMPLDQVQRWLEQIASGLAYLHDHGIVHRDLKPGNIFLDEGVVKIGDYGLSKFISASRRSGQTESVGTFHYMAPEVGRGRYGKEIDVYALGIVLYEMLTGHVPFDGESSHEIIMKHLTAQPRLDRIPADFRSAVRKALAKDPDMRLGSIRDMMCQLPQMSPSAGRRWEEPLVAEAVVHSSHGNARPTRPYGCSPAGSPTDALAPVAAGGSSARRSGPDEPIARAVHELWVRLRRGWRSANFGLLTRIVILLALGLALVSNLTWLIPFSLSIGTIYLAYLLIRALVLDVGSPPAPPTKAAASASRREPAAAVTQTAAAVAPPQPARSPVAGFHPARHGKRRRWLWEELARQQLKSKSPRTGLMELCGSLLMAAAVSLVVCLVMIIFGNDGLGISFFSWAPFYAWMSLTSVAGAWTILVASKVWEGRTGEPSLRRFVMLAIGLVVGSVAYLLSQLLDVQPTHLLHVPRPFYHYPSSLFAPNGTPSALAYLGYFAALFFGLRWWKQTDPLRASRLSLWSTFLCVLWAMVLFALLPFPRGFLVAASISIAVQLAAPWISKDQRKELKQAALEA